MSFNRTAEAEVVVPSRAPSRSATERSEPRRARSQPVPTSAPKAKAKAKSMPLPPPEASRPARAEVSDISRFRSMSHRDKNIKLLELARRALRTKHPGLRDPNDVTKVLVHPGERNFTGHTERFMHDPQYCQQLRAAGCVDAQGKLARWTKDERGKDVYKDFEEVVAQERAGKGAQKGKGRGPSSKPSSAPSSSSSRGWEGSSSWNWRGSSWR